MAILFSPSIPKNRKVTEGGKRSKEKRKENKRKNRGKGGSSNTQYAGMTPRLA